MAPAHEAPARRSHSKPKTPARKKWNTTRNVAQPICGEGPATAHTAQLSG